MPGVASTIDLDQLRAAADHSATFRTALARHGLAVYAQIQQTAGCNASHTVESRLARCLLHTRDLSGSDKLVLTQESMAQMIGARRNSVSLVANTLQQANFIHYSRGHIEITNLDGLIKTSCECYATVKAQYTGCCSRAFIARPRDRSPATTGQSPIALIRMALTMRARIAPIAPELTV